MNNGRKRRDNLREQIWRYRQDKSNNSTLMKSTNEISNIIDEADDVASELIPLNSSTPRRVLRSHTRLQKESTFHMLEGKISKLYIN